MLNNNQTYGTNLGNGQVYSDPTEILLKIINGDVQDLHVPNRSIVTGKKIKNKILRKFIEAYRKLNKLTDKQLVDVLLSFDEVVEKELLTEDILDQIRNNPSILNKIVQK